MVPTAVARQVGRSHVVFRPALTICGALLLLAAQFYYTSAGPSLFVGSTLPPPLRCNRNLDIGAGAQLRVRSSPPQNLFWDAVTGDSILRLKEQLRHAPKANTLALLLRTWKMQGGSSAHVSLADLRGVWELHSPAGSGSHPHESNFLRTVFDLYTSSFGRRLDMELISAPRVIVLRDGVTRTVSWLKWGGFTDMVMVNGKLQRLVEGGFRDSPKALSSKALQVTVPFPQPPRDLHVAYYDGDLLVMRDSSGVVDILWRQRRVSERGPSSWRAAEEREEEVEDDYEEDEEDEDEEEKGKESAVREKDVGIDGSKATDSSRNAERDKAVAELEVAMKHKRDEIESLRSSVPGLKAQLESQKEPMKDVLAQMKYHQKEVSKLAMKHEAERGGKEKAVSVMSRLVDQAKDAVGSLRRKKEEMDELRSDAEAELLALQESAEEHDGEVLSLKGMEESLLFQLPRLKKELNLAPRDEWEAYRAAIASAQEDLKRTRLSLRDALQQQAENERALKVSTAKLRKAEAAATKMTQAFNLMSAKSDRKAQEYEAKLEELNSKTSSEESLEDHRRALRHCEEHEAMLRKERDQAVMKLGGVESAIPELERSLKDLERSFQRKKKEGGRPKRFRFPSWPWR